MCGIRSPDATARVTNALGVVGVGFAVRRAPLSGAMAAVRGVFSLGDCAPDWRTVASEEGVPGWQGGGGISARSCMPSPASQPDGRARTPHCTCKPSSGRRGPYDLRSYWEKVSTKVRQDPAPALDACLGSATPEPESKSVAREDAADLRPEAWDSARPRGRKGAPCR